MQNLKEYIYWIYKKIKLNERVRSVQINEKEIYWCSLGENIGDEENGKGNDFRRPVMVFKKFNNSICWAIPMTTKNKDNKYYVKVSLNSTIQSAMISQMRLLDTRRFDEKIGFINQEDFNSVKKSIIYLINE
jgi:mRNA-degrading endonuclease toxin of MazEF toxin-antitoxin module